jgi:hypothetical protein
VNNKKLSTCDKIFISILLIVFVVLAISFFSSITVHANPGTRIEFHQLPSDPSPPRFVVLDMYGEGIMCPITFDFIRQGVRYSEHVYFHTVYGFPPPFILVFIGNPDPHHITGHTRFIYGVPFPLYDSNVCNAELVQYLSKIYSLISNMFELQRGQYIMIGMLLSLSLIFFALWLFIGLLRFMWYHVIQVWL